MACSTERYCDLYHDTHTSLRIQRISLNVLVPEWFNPIQYQSLVAGLIIILSIWIDFDSL
jgi:hypothetical protein